MALFIIRYGEIGLKSTRVRHRFEKILVKNITARFVALGKECRIERERGRIFLWSDHVEDAMAALERTFGIVSFSQAEECAATKEEIYRLAIECSKPLFRKGMSFCIRARRTGEHDYTSMELARDVGSAVYVANEHLEPRVDLGDPDLEIFVEVRQNRAFVFTEKIPGPGGLPVGTQGTVLCLLEAERDMAAAWFMMKRGCRVIIVGEEALASPLRNWDPALEVLEAGLVMGLNGLKDAALQNWAEGVVLGWSLGDFEEHKEEVTDFGMPVYYPLMGLTDDMIEDILVKISVQ